MKKTGLAVLLMAMVSNQAFALNSLSTVGSGIVVSGMTVGVTAPVVGVTTVIAGVYALLLANSVVEDQLMVQDNARNFLLHGERTPEFDMLLLFMQEEISSQSGQTVSDEEIAAVLITL